MTEEKKSIRMPTISHVLCWTCLHLDPPNYQLWPWLGYLSSVTVSPFVLLCTSDLTIRYNRLKLILTLKNEILKILDRCFMAHIHGNISRYNLFWIWPKMSRLCWRTKNGERTIETDFAGRRTVTEGLTDEKRGQPTLLLFGGTQPGQG